MARDPPKAEKTPPDTVEGTAAFSEGIVSVVSEVQFGVQLNPQIAEGIQRELDGNIST